MSLVSVCIAASDRIDLLLGRCLPSIFRQTFQGFEICIVGDQVEAAVAERILALDDPRVRFENLAHRGPYPRPGLARWHVAGTNPMNAAMRMAKGDYLCHIDDDDEMVADKLEVCLAAAQASEGGFVHHTFMTQLPNRQWVNIGNGSFALGQVTTGAVFYDRRFAAEEWDVYAYKRGTPGDWDRFSRIVERFRPKTVFLDNPLLWHHRENNYSAFVAKPGETFLED